MTMSFLARRKLTIPRCRNTVSTISRAKSTNGGDDDGSCKRVSREMRVLSSRANSIASTRRQKDSFELSCVRGCPPLVAFTPSPTYPFPLSYSPSISPSLFFFCFFFFFSSFSFLFFHLFIDLFTLFTYPRSFPSFPCLRIYLLLCLHFLPLLSSLFFSSLCFSPLGPSSVSAW